MSVPDIFLEEPTDDELCQEHERYKPCRACQLEAAEYRSECKREERYGDGN